MENNNNDFTTKMQTQPVELEFRSRKQQAKQKQQQRGRRRSNSKDGGGNSVRSNSNSVDGGVGGRRGVATSSSGGPITANGGRVRRKRRGKKRTASNSSRSKEEIDGLVVPLDPGNNKQQSSSSSSSFFNRNVSRCSRSTLPCMNFLAKALVWSSVVALVACVVWYSYELKNNGTDPHLIAWFSAGAFVLLGFPISMWGIISHLANYNQPHTQCYIVRILWMVPLYSMESWLCLRFHHYAVYIETFRDCYESYVLYSFLQFLIQILGGENALILMLKDKSPTRGVHMWGLQWCVKPWLMGQPIRKTYDHHHQLHDISNSGTDGKSSKSAATTSSKRPSQQTKRVYWTSPFFIKCKFGVLQYVLLKFVSSIFVMILELNGLYKEGDFTSYRSGYIYICILTNVSQCWALYCLIFFYYATKTELASIRPVGKFLSVKALVFFTWWQSVGISILYQYDMIPHYQHSELDEQQVQVGDGIDGGSGVGMIENSDSQLDSMMEDEEAPYYWTSADVAKGIQDYLICIEMFVAAIVHIFVFPHQEFMPRAIQARARALSPSTAAANNSNKAINDSSNYYYNSNDKTGFTPSSPKSPSGVGMIMRSSKRDQDYNDHVTNRKRLGRRYPHAFLSKSYYRDSQENTNSNDSFVPKGDNRNSAGYLELTAVSSNSWDKDTLNITTNTLDDNNNGSDHHGGGNHDDHFDLEAGPRPSQVGVNDDNDINDHQDDEQPRQLLLGTETIGHDLQDIGDESDPTAPILDGSAAFNNRKGGDDHYNDEEAALLNQYGSIDKVDDDDDDMLYGFDDDDEFDEEDEDEDDDDCTASNDDDDDDDDDDMMDSDNDEVINVAEQQQQHQPPATKRPNFVRALLDSTIPLDLRDNTVGIVKGDYVVEKKTLLHHAATSDSYDLFSDTRRRTLMNAAASGRSRASSVSAASSSISVNSSSSRNSNKKNAPK